VAFWPATQTHTTAGIVPDESRESALQICEDTVLWMTQHSRILHRKKPKRKAQEIERDVLRLFAGKSPAYARGAAVQFNRKREIHNKIDHLHEFVD
jgi:hypothetical protein